MDYCQTRCLSCLNVRPMVTTLTLLLPFVIGSLSTGLTASEFKLKKEKGTVTVMRDGKPLTTYHEKSGAKPVLWPLLGPGGEKLTRAFPMEEGVAGEAADHPHHRSLWFTHGDVNGVSFWHETEGHGTIKHLEYTSLESGEQATIETRNAWVTNEGELLCEDERCFVFGGDETAYWIDVDIKVTAKADEVVFGDTKEGSFGVRVAGTMKEDAKQGGKIMTSEGLTGSEAWGKPAAWVDYHGPVDGKTLGIAIMNHPDSYGFPSHWHVRTYGLFAANPFGLHDFYGGESGKDGTLKLKKGESFALRYRVFIHEGDEKEGQVEANYKAFTKG